MNAWFKTHLTKLAILALGFLVVTGVHGAQTDRGKKIARFAEAYRAAKTDSGRRAVCLNVIDEGLVARGSSVAVLDTIFDTKFAGILPPEGETERGVVVFSPQLKSSRSDVQIAQNGWYFAFQFDSRGKVQDYFLSNLHK